MHSMQSRSDIKFILIKSTINQIIKKNRINADDMKYTSEMHLWTNETFNNHII